MRLGGAVGIAGGLLVVAGILWWSYSQRAPGEKTTGRSIVVAAAADLRFALDDIVAEFQRSHPDIQVHVSYGSSGNLLHQLENRAPFDLFLSADVDYPRRLVAEGLALPDSEFVYAVGHLVVWVPQSSALDLNKLGIRALLEPSVRKIAIANPKYAPYGRAAEAALKSLGVYDQIQERLVYGENVAQTAQFVQTGASDAAIIGLSQAQAPTLRTQGRYWQVPADAYPRMEQGGIILSWVKDQEAAEAFRAFLLGQEGRGILRCYGFSLSGE